MANFDPTAANIIASLGVKGATVGTTTGSQYQGFVPVLDASGKLSASLIPSEAAQASIPALSNVTFVDPYTTVSASARNGSVAAPFISLAEAVGFIQTESAQSAMYAAFMLAPGKYQDTAMAFPSTWMPLSVYLIGLGKVEFATSITEFAISGMSEITSGVRPSVWIQGITINGRIKIVSNADVTVVGNSYIGELSGATGMTLKLASDSRVSSTSAETVSYLSEDTHVKNNSSVTGTTVHDALGRLGARRIRVSRVAADSSGFEIDSSSSFIDITAESCSGVDIFDLRERDRVFVAGINELFRRSQDIEADTVTANTITADVANITELNMSYMNLGGYRLTVDTYGYLVVLDGTETPPQPPSNVILISDTVTGAIYMIGVSSGRIYIAPADIDSSYSSSSSSSVQEYITVYDPETGYTYSLSIQNGRMVITRIGG